MSPHPRRVTWTLHPALRERLERLHFQAKAKIPSEEDFGLALLALGLQAFERQLEHEAAKDRLVQPATPADIVRAGRRSR